MYIGVQYHTGLSASGSISTISNTSFADGFEDDDLERFRDFSSWIVARQFSAKEKANQVVKPDANDIPICQNPWGVVYPESTAPTP